MKKRGSGYLALTLIVLAIFGFLVIDYMQTAGNFSFTGKVISPIIPEDCSDASVKTIWDSIFKESSNGISIQTNGTVVNERCAEFYAYKTIGDSKYILEEKYYSSSPEITINAYHLNSSITLPATPSEARNFNFGSDNATSRSLTDETANSTFISIFKEDNITWTNEGTYLYFEKDLTNSSAEMLIKGTVYKTLSYEYLGIEITPTNSCSPNWTAVNASCNSSDTLEVWYNDSNSCDTSSEKPDNKTEDCDYNSNGIIGNSNSFTNSNLNITLYIDSSEANFSKIYNTTKQVELKEGNISRISFSYNFSNTLNLNEIEIIKQNSSSEFGYLIVNGVEEEKTFYVDKKISRSNRICIKNAFTSSITAFSEECNSSNEYLINCPGTNSLFECNISGSYFVVSGLTHSAVKEIISNCNPQWNCTSWSSCISGNQIRSCIDTNFCGIISGKPAENQTCAVCIPNPNCIDWLPKTCPKNGTQTRTCIDLNNCGTIPPETRDCEYKKIPVWLIILGVVILLGGIIIMIILLVSSGRKKDSQQNNQDNPYRPFPGQGQIQQPQSNQMIQNPQNQYNNNPWKK